MNNPISTYRLQFHKDFSFDDFEKVIPYLQKLGVSTVYASPVFTSTPGSTHGYDGMNPHEINPEVGSEDKLRAIVKSLHSNGINWLQDIVPNHMAFHPENPWLMDVLEKGRQSVYSGFFDIDWDSQFDNGKLMVPFLGAPVDEVLNNELRIAYDGKRLVFQYYEASYPLNPASYAAILSRIEDKHDDVKTLIVQLDNLHQIEEPLIYEQQWSEFLLQFSSLIKHDQGSTYITDILTELNADRAEIKKIAAQQNYSLKYWKDTNKQINFRRFFTVNGLICLNIQDEKVFTHFHSYIKTLLDEGIFQGLRIDHIDGLFDPESYLTDLRSLVGEGTYVVVEKILEPGEDLPVSWPIQGTTGYEFLAALNNLFTYKKGEKTFSDFYAKLTGDTDSVHKQIHAKKTYILTEQMAGELENLYQLFIASQISDYHGSKENLKAVIGEFLIQCPVYRYYGNSFPLVPSEADAVRSIIRKIRKDKAELKLEVDLLEEIFLVKPQFSSHEYNLKVQQFYQRCMQFSGPLMAKGVEDTLMYTYNRFIGHNEVGDSPEAFGMDAEEFHKTMLARQQNWPLSLNGTSTHDTKRGEDVRARLNVLTELGEDWIETVRQWQYLNKEAIRETKLDAGTEYFIYQALAGALPMPGQDASDLEGRFHEYLEKSLREGKVHSDWSDPNEVYENAAKKFVSGLLDTTKPFYAALQKFNKRIADFSVVNSLSQVLLKFLCPGVPDVYQGCELWDFSLVDPDNRRPVDYAKRAQILEHVANANLQQLWEDRYSGEVKLWLTTTLLQLRKTHAELFEKGEYIPLKVKGKYKEHILAFARKFQKECIVVVVPLHTARLCKKDKIRLTELDWKSTRIILPEMLSGQVENVLTKSSDREKEVLLIKEIFGDLPIGILKIKEPIKERGAGLLLHITSLPSKYGIGDMGPSAREFARYLKTADQRYWQILPLNPTEEGQGFSPYSAISSMAGNTLLISPDLLAEDGLLDKDSLKSSFTKSKSRVDFVHAKKVKEKLLDEAFANFDDDTSSALHPEFESFCVEEEEWLTDFSLYLAIKQKNGGKPWYEWPEDFKLRNPTILENFRSRYSEDIRKIKWQQFIFLRQWMDLKAFCNQLNIDVFGDLPFYVSNDSSDVWANKDLFSLDADGKMTGLAGVPPDYFNDNGQLWGMPVFKWDVLKEKNYSWWIKRIRKNIQLFDLVRLDHFRAFSSYWDVPSGEETARNGVWRPGPASDFFEAMQKEFGELPFIAEDLGDVDKDVYDLRDKFNMPGMRVIQFTFGNDISESIHSPHNYTANSVVYTGTHDNNTTRGWFRQDSSELVKENILLYTGSKADEKDIHLTLSKLAYASVSKIVILPFQDVIGLDEGARMNTPASIENNWSWRLKSSQLKQKHSERLKNWVRLYNR